MMEIFGIRRRIRDLFSAAREAEQLRVQLAGVLTAVEGHVDGSDVAVCGQYGWSLPYQKVVELRRRMDRAVGVAELHAGAAHALLDPEEDSKVSWKIRGEIMAAKEIARRIREM